MTNKELLYLRGTPEGIRVFETEHVLKEEV